MAIPTGLSAQLGVATETTYGTPATVTRFYELTDESMRMDIERLETAGLRAGQRIVRSDRWVAGRKTVAGDVSLEVPNKSLGLLLLHAFGTASSSNPTGSVYEHTFTPADLPVGMTTQVGRPSLDGTVNPFTYHGCKVASWELSADVGQIGQFRMSLVAEDEDTSTSLETASYPSALSLLTFADATLTIAGSSQTVRSVRLRGDNGLAADRHVLGAQVVATPLEAGMRNYEVDIDAHFDDTTAYGRFVNGTEAALVLKYEGATITTGYAYTLQATCNVRFDGDTPQVSGPEEIPQPLRAKCIDTGSGASSAISVLYRTTDTSV
jgi:hypothetical protein